LTGGTFELPADESGLNFFYKFLGHKVIKCQIKKKSYSKYSIEESIHTGRLKPTAGETVHGEIELRSQVI
jgi:hypothetical protein